MKKNTMLTLDNDLVEKARALGLNLSAISAEAIKMEVASKSIKNLIPSVKSLKLHNVGPFKDVSLSFTDGLNIICGTNGSGKSTILRSLIYAFDRESGPRVRDERQRGSVEVELFSKKVIKNIGKSSGGVKMEEVLLLSPDVKRRALEREKKLLLERIKRCSDPTKRGELKAEMADIDRRVEYESVYYGGVVDKKEPAFPCLSAGEKQLIYIQGLLNIADAGDAILLDDFDIYFPEQTAQRVMKKFQSCGHQVIVTMRNSDKLPKNLKAMIYQTDVSKAGIARVMRVGG
jgi:ABC-type glutathione transport system ATPase component